MVCPNCHSKQVIQVQNQHFCINCGQVVPEPVEKTPAPAKVSIQVNGLPEGVKILSPSGTAPELAATATPATATTATATTAEPAPDSPKPSDTPPAAFIKNRSRARPKSEEPGVEAKVKRKPGRPKAGRLDVPRPVAATMAAPLPEAPKLAPSPVPAPDAPDPTPSTAAASGLTVRSMNDIAPRKPAGIEAAAATATNAKTKVKAKKPGFTFASLFKPAKNSRKANPKHHASQAGPTVIEHITPAEPTGHTANPQKHTVHKVGVPPLHYGAVVRFSLRARIQPRLFAIATLASLSFAAVTAYSAWLLLGANLNSLASSLSHNISAALLIELAIFTALYYIGRNVGQSAITFGVTRDVDQRPVSLSRQLGVGINTFGKHFRLDFMFTIGELILIGLAAGLMLIGGETWPVSSELQVAALFTAFLVLLYFMTALTLSHGLASVALTLTNLKVFESTKLGWKLFSHRFELLGLRFVAIAIELLLALPLVALAALFIIKAPDGLHVLVTVAVGFLALFTGSLFGAGTASWWAALYRRIVQVDQPNQHSSLLSGQKSLSPSSGRLAFIVALSSFLVAAAAATPWLHLP